MSEFTPVDIEKFIKDDVNKAYEEYKQVRKQPSRKKANIFMILTVVFVLLGGLLAWWLVPWMEWNTNFPTTWAWGISFSIGIGFLIASIWLYCTYSTKYNKFWNDFFKAINIHLYYNKALSNLTQGYLDKTEMKSGFISPIFKLGAFVKHEDAFTGDVLTFTVEGQQFSYGVISSRVLIFVDKRGNRQYKYDCQTFLIGNFTENFIETPTNLYFKGKSFFKESTTEKVELESDEFNEYANPYSNSQVMCRKFFTPKKMANLLNLKSEYDQSKAKYLFLDRNSVLCEVKNLRSAHTYDYSLTRLNNPTSIDQLVEQIFHRVDNESRDIYDLLKFFQVLELFPE